MPRPAQLATIDWPKQIEQADSYVEWLKQAEFAENAAAMETQRKSVVLSTADRERLEAVRRTVYVYVFAEDWCGDVVRHVPVLEKIADFSPHIVTRYSTRSEAPEIFVRFLTNGGEAVPKFVFLSELFVECGSWGPMSTACRELIARGKACGNVSRARELVAERYKADESKREVIDELLTLVEIAATSSLE